jgi:F0F1-type ATP synthase membrane subunit b/b'
VTETRNEYIAKAREKLEVLDSKIVALEAQVGAKAGEARREFRTKLSEIKQSRDRAERRLQELRLASKPAWEDVKQGVEKAWKSLETAVDRAKQEFH